MKKLKQTIKNYKMKIYSTIAFASAGLVAPALATQVADVTADQMMGLVIDIILKVASYVGSVMIVFAAFQLIMAFKDENPDAKTRATMLIISGVFLFGLRSVLTLVGFLV